LATHLARVSQYHNCFARCSAALDLGDVISSNRFERPSLALVEDPRLLHGERFEVHHNSVWIETHHVYHFCDARTPFRDAAEVLGAPATQTQSRWRQLLDTRLA
jgi:hypothetical protein